MRFRETKKDVREPTELKMKTLYRPTKEIPTFVSIFDTNTWELVHPYNGNEGTWWHQSERSHCVKIRQQTIDLKELHTKDNNHRCLILNNEQTIGFISL